MRLSHYLSFSALLLLASAAPMEMDMEEMEEHNPHSHHSASHSKSGTHTKSAHHPPPSHSGAMKSHHSAPPFPKKTRMSATPTATSSDSPDPSPSPAPPTLADIQALIPDLPVALPLAAALKVNNRVYGKKGNSQSQGAKGGKGNKNGNGKGMGGKEMKGNATEVEDHDRHSKRDLETKLVQGMNDDGRV